MREGPRGASGSVSLGRVRPAARALSWGVVFWLAGQVGLVTTLHDRPLALVAPSAGVLAIWFAFSTRRTLPYDVAAVAVFGMAISAQLGLPWPLVLFGVVISLSQAGVFVLVMSRFAPTLAPFGGTRESWRVGDLGVFVAAAVSAALWVAVISTVSQGLAGIPSNDLATVLVRWGRASSTIVVVGAVGLLLGPSLRRAWQEDRLGDWVRARLAVTSARRIEAMALVATSAALYLACFYVLEELPITFVLFVCTAWAGIRFSPATAATYSVLAGAVGVVSTLYGHGIFAVVIDDPAQRAVVAQLFVLVTAATALCLAIARSQLADAERLAESRLQTLDQVLHFVNDGVMVVEEDGRVLVVNRAGKDLFDIDEESFDHVRPTRSFQLYEADGSRLVEERAPYRRALRGEEVSSEELELRRADGSVRYLRLNAQMLPSLGAGFARRVLLSYHDVTGDRLRQDALATFAGHVAHDLRNPLSVVEAWNEVLHDALETGETVTPEYGLPMTTKIGAASTRMRDFIQGLLDYTLARDRALSPSVVDLARLASDVAEMRSQALGVELPPEISVIGSGQAWADPELLRIVIDNLVSNACKYVAPGVRPQVVVLLEQSGADTVSICVADNGIGIPAEEREAVFDSFHRVEQGGRFEGSGMGLGICRRIVERHGGTIAVEDTPEGSRLRVTLPRALSAPEAPPEPELVAG